MKYPSSSFCKACGRDLAPGAACSHCDVAVAVAPVPISQTERVFRCVERHPGLGVGELGELLGQTDELAMDALMSLLYRMVRSGSLRSEGGRMEKTYFAADATKLTKSRDGSGTGAVRYTPKRKLSKQRKQQKRIEAKTRYDARKAAGVCVKCGGEKDPGLIRCRPCHEKERDAKWAYRTSDKGRAVANAQSKRLYWSNPEKHRERSRQDYLAYKSEGICPYCGQRPAMESNLLCVECAPKATLQKRMAARARRERLKLAGLCQRCGKKPSAIEGGYACGDCMETERAHGRAYKQRVKQARAA